MTDKLMAYYLLLAEQYTKCGLQITLDLMAIIATKLTDSL